jgi:peptide/nickel transport system substrate-binding protein
VLAIVCRSEPLSAINSTSSRAAIVPALFSAALGAFDEAERPYPVLAEALPALNTPGWIMFPDGRMETTHTLRANLRWHDGTPLVAEDFRFGWRAQQVLVAAGAANPSTLLKVIDEVVAPDARTVVIRWSGGYGDAYNPALFPRPRHVLESALETSTAEAFSSHPYWFGEHLGAGPYRMDRWEPGSFIEGSAFDDFVLGRPRIDRIRVTWSSDPNATLARLLSGDAHMAVDDALQFQQALTLRREWQDGAPLILSPNRLRYGAFQARPEYVDPRSMLDVRVRRAITHALDRKTLADAMLEGEGMVAESPVPPTVAYQAEVERVITRYPYDPRRVEQVMAEVGYTKGADGFFTSSTAGRFSPKVSGTAEGQEGQETTIVVDLMRQSGIDAGLSLIPAAQRDASDELKATYPAMSMNNATLSDDPGLNKFYSPIIASPANRWSGSNKSGYSNPEYDRLYDAWLGAVDPRERERIVVQATKFISEEVPMLPMYFNYLVVAHAQALEGPLPKAPASTPHHNVHAWRWK